MFSDEMLQHLKEELNVKEVAVSSPEEVTGLFTYSIKPNLALLGPKYGSQLKLIRKELQESNPASIAQSINKDGCVYLAGCNVTLSKDEVLIEIHPIPGLAAGMVSTSMGQFVVMLDTRLSPDLIAEGICRDTIRVCQDYRKRKGFNYNDKVDISAWTPNRELRIAIEQFSAMILSELLAKSWEWNPTVNDMENIKIRDFDFFLKMEIIPK